MPKKSKLPEKIVKYLEKAGVSHEILEHKTVYTALDAAVTMKKKIGEIAKSLLVKADRDYFLVLLPADQNVDFEKLKKTIGKIKDKEVKIVKIPGEKIMQEALKIKAGALSAFGNFHKIPVIVEDNLAKAKKAIFSSGSLNHSVEMAVKDFAKLESAVFGKFGIKKKIKTVKAISPKIKKKPVVAQRKKIVPKKKALIKKKK